LIIIFYSKRFHIRQFCYSRCTIIARTRSLSVHSLTRYRGTGFNLFGEVVVHISSRIPPTQWAKSPKRQSEGVHSALKLQCHIVKNTLLHTAFSAIFPTGNNLIRYENGAFTSSCQETIYSLTKDFSVHTRLDSGCSLHALHAPRTFLGSHIGFDFDGVWLHVDMAYPSLTYFSLSFCTLQASILDSVAAGCGCTLIWLPL